MKYTLYLALLIVNCQLLIINCPAQIAPLFKALALCTNDSCRQTANKEILAKLEPALKADAQMKFSFEGVENCGVLVSDNKNLRIINWNLPSDTGETQYFGFMQVYNSRLKKYISFKLTDKSSTFAQPDRGVLTPDKWYGCLYYNIIETKAGSNKLYTLFGVDFANGLLNRKVIEVLTINSKGVPSFGGNYFQQYYPKPKKEGAGQDPGMPKAKQFQGKKTLLKTRVLLEFKAGVQVKLVYNSGIKTIEVPHLSPDNPSLVGQFQFYGPDFSTDAYKWENGKWVIYEDMDARNRK